MKKRVDVMVTAFRDGFQSVYGARVLTDDFIPAVEAARAAGVTHYEAGGGARFQALYFYCNEDAFTMMDRFRLAAGPDANLQTLSRGVNVVGLDSQPRDIIKLHAQLFKKHGITTIRNFDALNDVNNLIHSGQYIHEAGLKHEVVVTLMSMPPGTQGDDIAHTPEFYTNTLKQILASGIPFDSVCYKDASGTSTPKTVFESIKQARAILPPEISLKFHSHDTAGTCISQYMAALDAGADGIDLSMAPVSGGTCQSDIISMWHALRGTDYDLDIDVDKMREAEEIFKDCMKDYFMPPEAKAVEPLIPFSPMPGGALTANTQMLRDNNMMDRYPEIIRNMSEVVKLGGFGTSVTPVSQFYFQQAFNNTIFGPWEKIADGYGKMVLGYFGKTPLPPDSEIVKICSKQMGLEPTTELVVDINEKDPGKGRAAASAMLKEAGIAESEENIFIAATCKEKGIQFLLGKATLGVRKHAPGDAERIASGSPTAPNSGQSGPAAYSVSIDGKNYNVTITTEGKALVNGKEFSIATGSVSGVKDSGSPGTKGETTEVTSPLPGLVLRILKNPGDGVEKDETIMVLEAMKMETEIQSPIAGTISSINVEAHQQVQGGQALAEIE